MALPIPDPSTDVAPPPLHPLNGAADAGVAADAAAALTAAAKVRSTRWVAVASLAALILLGLAWELRLAPTGSGTLALKALPLFVPLPGLLRNRMYTYRWLSLMVWLYFTEGVVRATSEHGTGAVLAVIEVLLCLLLFAACAAHVRLRLARSDAVDSVAAPAGAASPVAPATPSAP